MPKQSLLRQSKNSRWWSLVCICAGLWLYACTPARRPLEFTQVIVSPDPSVGQLATLEVQLVSTDDEEEVSFEVDILEQYIDTQLHVVAGETAWRGPLVANEVKTFQLVICVAQEGNWPLELYAYSHLPSGQNKWLTVETIHIESTITSGHLIRGWEYTFSQEEATNRPTPVPVKVSAECAGQTE